jgi:PhzF family phenazine biosynthesis protein
MELSLYQVDAFADRVFEGNPAAVVPLEQWPDDATLQAIAEENNLSETAFFTAEDEGYRLRWFTPGGEVDLCGHATLGTAHVLFEHLGLAADEVRFDSRSGPLVVRRVDAGLELDFPAASSVESDITEGLVAALGDRPEAVLSGPDVLAVFADEARVRALEPDFRALAALPGRGLIATAPGTDFDFVSRCFFPRYNVDEDPVTGSAHCQLMPYWAERLGRDALLARQVSRRGGTLRCRLAGDRVRVAGTVVDYLQGMIRIG